jgi:hypothetical protein
MLLLRDEAGFAARYCEVAIEVWKDCVPRTPARLHNGAW